MPLISVSNYYLNFEICSLACTRGFKLSCPNSKAGKVPVADNQSLLPSFILFLLELYLSHYSPVCALHPDVGMHFSADPASLTGCLGGPVCGSAGGEGLLGGVPDRNSHRVVKVWYVTILTMMTTSGAGTDSDNAMSVGH